MESGFRAMYYLTGVFVLFVYGGCEYTWTNYEVYSGNPYSGSCELCLLQCLKKASSIAGFVGAKFNPKTSECESIYTHNFQTDVSSSDDFLIKRRLDVMYNEPIMAGSMFWYNVPGTLQIASFVEIFMSSSTTNVRFTVTFGLDSVAKFMTATVMYDLLKVRVGCEDNGILICDRPLIDIDLMMDTVQKFTFLVTADGIQMYLDHKHYHTFNDPLNTMTVDQVEFVKVTSTYSDPAYLLRATFTIF